MIIAITCEGQTLADKLDSRFGRAANFIIYNSEDGSFRAVPNTQNLNAAQGAGIQAAMNVVDQKAEAVITGHCGPKAFRVLQTAGLKIFLTGAGTVQEALNLWKDGSLTAVDSADVEGHWA